VVLKKYEKEVLMIIKNVGNARDKGDRGDSSTPEDELSYDLYNPITQETHRGICGHSGVTSQAKALSEEEVELHVLREYTETNIAIITLREKNYHLLDYFKNILKKELIA
jgi:hypothetical protein